MTLPSRTIQVRDIAMHVVVAGDGPDVLLVHGYPDDHTVWREQIPALIAAGYRVIAPDTRGCGETEIAPAVSSYHVDNLADDLVALLDALKVDKVRLVGHDWGSAISWNLAIRYPDRVDRYVALATGHLSAYTSGGFEQKLKGYYTMLFQLRGFTEWLLSSFDWFVWKLMTQYPEEQANWIAKQSRSGRLTAGLNYYRANAKLFITGRAPKAKVPVMGVWGAGDLFLAEGQMKASADFVDAPFKYVRIEGANHWLQLTAPEKFNAVLLDYLK